MKKIVLLLMLIMILTSCAIIQPAAKKNSSTENKSPAATAASDSTDAELKQNQYTKTKEKNSVVNTMKYTPKTVIKNPVATTSGNIKSLELSAKANGTMIRIDTDEQFSEKDIAVSISQDNFINITIYRGKLDKYFPDNLKSIGDLADISYYSFPESAQLTIRLTKKVVSKSVFVKADKIIISLFESE